MDKLKKCPFCGGEAQVFGGTYNCWVECCDCGCVLKPMQNQQEDRAIKTWNTRKEISLEDIMNILKMYRPVRHCEEVVAKAIKAYLERSDDVL